MSESSPPEILDREPIEFDVDDVDGALAMLDPELSGCLGVRLSAPVAADVGQVSVDGDPVHHLVRTLRMGPHRVTILGIRLAGVLHRPDMEHVVVVEGFRGEDGTEMPRRVLQLVTRARPAPDPRFAEHEGVARRVATEGTVLLENHGGTLPLRPGVLNVFGEALHVYRTSILGAGKINPRYAIGLRDAILEHSSFSLNDELSQHYRTERAPLPGALVIERARALSDIGIVVVSRAAGENNDVTSAPGDFRLTTNEEDLVALVAREFRRCIVILNTPFPLDVTPLRRHGVDAIVLAGVGGMLAGPALLDILSGAENPSGRLPDTWASSYADIPAGRNFYDASDGRPRYDGDADVWIDTVYEESIYVGYRYFTTFDVAAAYPFGHGLSYTTFEMEVGRLEPARDTSDDRVIDVRVTNTGPVTGREVVQIYVSKPDAEIENPVIDLVDFAKTSIVEPGQGAVVRCRIRAEDLAAWNEQRSASILAAGEYTVFVGRSAAHLTEAGRFALVEDVVIQCVPPRLAPPLPIATLSKRHPVETFPSGDASGVRVGASGFSPIRIPVPAPSPRDRASSVLRFADVIADPSLAAAYVRGLTVCELARVVVCGKNGWGMEGTGVAGILAELPDRHLPPFQVADGNSGVNVRRPNIGMPTTVVLASTFDRDLANEVGRVIGEEAKELGVDLILGPGMNLHRNPLNGRHGEYFSEDPILAGTMAGFFARGLESTGVGACYKHLVANNAESARKRNHSLIPERALRDLYLKAFTVALRTHQAVSVMTAYNAVNGRSAAGDPELILGYLREEQGFEGFVMTDWNSQDTCDVVDMAVAGVSWITPGGEDDSYVLPLIDAVESGRLTRERLEDNAAKLLRIVARLRAANSPVSPDWIRDHDSR